MANLRCENKCILLPLAMMPILNYPAAAYAAFAAIGVGLGAYYAGHGPGAGGASRLSQGLLPRWRGGVVLLAYAAALAILAVTATVRRDVS
jgi:hypothetical protein